MTHEAGEIIIDSLKAQYEVPVLKKHCSVRVLLALAAGLGFIAGAWLFM